MAKVETLELRIAAKAGGNPLRNYYLLTKPGIVYSNAMTAAAGFLLASAGNIVFTTLLALLIGTSLIIASACVVNNYIDRGIDRKMARTKKRALASGSISAASAMAYAFILLALGFWALSYTNGITIALGAAAFFSYVVLYAIAKRKSVHGTLVGTAPGAAALVAGYTSVSGRFNAEALVLFLIMVAWQMPHFYAIAIRRLADYKAAGLPVWPAKKGVESTQVMIVVYVFLFGVFASLLSFLGYAGKTYLIVMLALSLYWLKVGLEGFKALDSKKWAGKTFGLSLVVLLVFSLMLSLNSLLP